MEWYYWAAIILAIIIILPDPIGMFFGWVLDRWFNEFEEKGIDVSTKRHADLEEAGEFRALDDTSDS